MRTMSNGSSGRWSFTGRPGSEFLSTMKKNAGSIALSVAYFVLNDARDRIYANIDCRVDLMLEHGLVEEVRRLQAQGCTRDMVSMQGLGYKEILDYLDGRCSYEEAVRVLKRDTRHFAKRQLHGLSEKRMSHG